MADTVLMMAARRRPFAALALQAAALRTSSSPPTAIVAPLGSTACPVLSSVARSRRTITTLSASFGFSPRPWRRTAPSPSGWRRQVRWPSCSVRADSSYCARKRPSYPCTRHYAGTAGDSADEGDRTDESDGPSKSELLPLSDDEIERQTIDWIQKVVIGLNLCPFAEQPARTGKLYSHVVRGDDDKTVATAVLYEMILRSDEEGTTVVIAPEYRPDDFEAFLSLVQFLEEEVMEENDLTGRIQLVPFHPFFRFEGSDENDVDNCTNRSPYPMFHILREDEVGRAVEKLGGDASKVWGRNLDLLERLEEKLGKDDAVRVLKGKDVDGVEDILRAVRIHGEREGEENSR